jgi:simple sugar transport system substrate-binding protein
MSSSRTVALLVALGACLALGACGEDEEGAGAAGGGGGEEVLVGFVPKSLESAFWLASRAGARAADQAHEDIRVLVEAGQSEAAVEQQISIVENLLTRGVQALAVAPTAPDQLLPVLQRAVQDDVPVVVVDTDIPELTGKTAFVGTDNVEAGRIAAEWMSEEMGGEGTVGIITGSRGVTSVEDRVRGFREGLEGSQIEVVDELRAEGCTRDTGVSAMEDMLTAHADVDAVFVTCGEPAVGATRAIASSNRDFDDILLVGFDATPDEIAAIEAGREDATIAQFPERMGRQGVEAAARAARGEEVPDTIDTGVEVVTRENAAEFR